MYLEVVRSKLHYHTRVAVEFVRLPSRLEELVQLKGLRTLRKKRKDVHQINDENKGQSVRFLTK